VSTRANDPSATTRIRNLADEVFGRTLIAAREPEVRELTDSLIDEFAQDRRVEFMSQFAHPLPGRVMCRVVGVPDSDAPQVLRWSDDMSSLRAATLPPERRSRAARESADFYGYCERFVDARRAKPRGDLISKLIEARHAELGEGALTNPELVSILSQLLIGGNAAIRHLIGSMMIRLLEHPGQMQAVQADPALIPAAMEATLPDGAGVLMWTTGAADTKIAFTRFAHMCIGAPLARLAVRVAFEQLLTRLPGLRRADDGSQAWAPRPVDGDHDRLDLVW
jgi:cytochrome P450